MDLDSDLNNMNLTHIGIGSKWLSAFGLLALIGMTFGKSKYLSIVGDVDYPLRLQPELDFAKPTQYFRTRNLVKLQMKCFFYGGPCDMVGQWAKPRLQTGFLGECLKCTKVQQDWISGVLAYMAEKFPDLFHAAVCRFIEYYGGIKLPEEHRRLVAKAFES